MRPSNEPASPQTLSLRLVYFPTPMNFGMGLTAVRFRDYFLGAGLTFLIGTVKQVWVSGNWSGLFSINVFLSLALFGSSFFIPRPAKRFSKAHGRDTPVSNRFCQGKGQKKHPQ